MNRENVVVIATKGKRVLTLLGVLCVYDTSTLQARNPYMISGLLSPQKYIVVWKMKETHRLLRISHQMAPPAMNGRSRDTPRDKT